MILRRYVRQLPIAALIVVAPAVASATVAAPTSVVARPISATAISLGWAFGGSASSFTIERSATADKGYQDIATVAGSNRDYQDRSLLASHTYYYRLRASQGSDISRRSDVVSATTPSATSSDNVPPSTPSALFAVAVDCTQINLAWKASTDTGGSGVRAYKLYRNGAFLREVVAPTTAAANGQLAASTRYTYVVTAVDDAGNESAVSPAASATTPECATVTPTVTPVAARTSTPILTATPVQTSTPVPTRTATRTVTPTPTPTATPGPIFDPLLVGFVPAIGDANDVGIVSGTAYLASDVFGLSSVRVSTPSAPSVLGAADTPFVGEHLAVSGTRAVVTGPDANGRAHLWTLDLSNPSSPTILGELSTTIAVGPVTGFLEVALDAGGTRAVAAMGMAGVWVIDITSPKAPVLRGSYDTPGTAYAVALNSTGSLAYVADGNGGLKIVSLANPSAPVLVGNLALSGVQRDLAVSGGVAYLADQVGRLVTVDVNSPAAPRQLGAFLLGRYAFHVAVEGTQAVVLDADSSNDYLEVLDVHTPATPVRVAATMIDVIGTARGVALSGGRAYVAASASGLRIYNVSGSASFTGSAADHFSPAHVAIAPSRAIVGGTDLPTNTTQFAVVDTTDSTTPRVTGMLSTSTQVGGVTGVFDIAIAHSGTLAVAAMGSIGVWTLDLSNPTAPAIRGGYDTPGTTFGVALNAAGTLAYIADGSGGLKILSLANPSAPTLVGSLAMSGLQRAVAVTGNVAYVADQVGRLAVVDVSTPTAPRQVGTFTLGRYAFQIAVEGTRVVVIDSDSASDYLEVLDVATPTAPTRLSALVVGAIGIAKGLAIAGNRAYVAATDDGLHIYDLANPSAPALLGTGYTAGAAYDVAVEGTAACIADFPATLSVVDLFAP